MNIVFSFLFILFLFILSFRFIIFYPDCVDNAEGQNEHPEQIEQEFNIENHEDVEGRNYFFVYYLNFLLFLHGFILILLLFCSCKFRH